MPVLEAMAAGVPVLTSNRSALPEVAGDAALAVDPEDSEALRAALCELAGNDDLRAKLGHSPFDYGAQLPGEMELAKAYNLSRGTIRAALDILAKIRQTLERLNVLQGLQQVVGLAGGDVVVAVEKRDGSGVEVLITGDDILQARQ